MLIVSGEEPEVDSGTAALMGMAFAMKKPILMYYSGNVEILGQGNQRMTNNLMLENACVKLCSSFDNLISTIENFLVTR
jgi:nucleoside 2-deoxyribosyltransferase